MTVSLLTDNNEMTWPKPHLQQQHFTLCGPQQQLLLQVICIRGNPLHAHNAADISLADIEVEGLDRAIQVFEDLCIAMR